MNGLFKKLKKNIPWESKKLNRIVVLYLTFINKKNVKYCIDFAIVINEPMFTILIKTEYLAMSIPF